MFFIPQACLRKNPAHPRIQPSENKQTIKHNTTAIQSTTPRQSKPQKDIRSSTQIQTLAQHGKNMSPHYPRLSLPTPTIRPPLRDSPLLYLYALSTTIYYTNEDEGNTNHNIAPQGRDRLISTSRHPETDTYPRAAKPESPCADRCSDMLLY